MSRFYLRMVLKYFEKTGQFLKNCANISPTFINSITYREKLKKVVLKTKNRLYSNVETINTTNQYQTAKIINKIR